MSGRRWLLELRGTRVVASREFWRAFREYWVAPQLAQRLTDFADRVNERTSRTPPGRPHEEGAVTVHDTNPLQNSQALFRTRTGDPFLTMEGQRSSPVTPGHNLTPHDTAPQAAGDPTGPDQRPQDAPSSDLPICRDPQHRHSGPCEIWGIPQTAEPAAASEDEREVDPPSERDEELQQQWSEGWDQGAASARRIHQAGQLQTAVFAALGDHSRDEVEAQVRELLALDAAALDETGDAS